MSKRPQNANSILSSLQTSENLLMGVYELFNFCQTQNSLELSEQQQFLMDCVSAIKSQNIRAGNSQLDNFIHILKNIYSPLFSSSSPAYSILYLKIGFVLTLLQTLGYELSTAPQQTNEMQHSRIPSKPQEFVQGLRRPPSDATMMHSEADPNFNIQMIQSGIQNIPSAQGQIPVQYINAPRQPQITMMNQEDAYSQQRFAQPINFAQHRLPTSNLVFFTNPNPRSGFVTPSPQIVQQNMGATYLVNNPQVVPQNISPFRFVRQMSQPNYVQINSVRPGTPIVRQPTYFVPQQNQQIRIPQFYTSVPMEQPELLHQPHMTNWQPNIMDGQNSVTAYIRPPSGMIERPYSQPTPAHPSNDHAKPSTIHYMPSMPQNISPHDDRRPDIKIEAPVVSTVPSRQIEQVPSGSSDLFATPTTIRLCNSIPMCDSSPAVELVEDTIRSLHMDLQVVSGIPESTFVEILAHKGNVTMPFHASHKFCMRESVFDSIHTREHIEVQFKCVTTAGSVNRWPESVNIRINNENVVVPPRDQTIGDECIFLKNQIRRMDNQIEVDCEVSGDSSIAETLPEEQKPIAFRFLINLVLKSTISVMLRALLQKRTQSVTKSIEFVQHYFVVNPIEMARGYTIVSFLDPSSGSRITVPVRGESCRHVQCLDFESLCLRHLNRTHFICPICNLVGSIPNVIIDGFMCSLISRLKDTPNVTQAKITPECNYTFITQNHTKTPPTESESPAPTPKFDLSNEDLIMIFGCDAPAAFKNALAQARVRLETFPELERQALSNPPKKRSYQDKKEEEFSPDCRDPNIFLSEAYSSSLSKNQKISNSNLLHKSADNLILPDEPVKKSNSFSSAPNYSGLGINGIFFNKLDMTDYFRFPREEFIDIDPNLSLNTVAQKDFVNTPNPLKESWDPLEDDFFKQMRDVSDSHLELKPLPGLDSSLPSLSKKSDRRNF